MVWDNNQFYETEENLRQHVDKLMFQTVINASEHLFLQIRSREHHFCPYNRIITSAKLLLRLSADKIWTGSFIFLVSSIFSILLSIGFDEQRNYQLKKTIIDFQFFPVGRVVTPILRFYLQTHATFETDETDFHFPCDYQTRQQKQISTFNFTANNI